MDIKYTYTYKQEPILKQIPSEITLNKPTIYTNLEIYNLDFIKSLNILNETYKDIYNQLNLLTNKYNEIVNIINELKTN